MKAVRDVVKRLWGWWLVSALASLGIAWFAPQQIGVLIYKALQVTLGIGLAYLADKELFRNVPQVDAISYDNFGAARILARAIICVAVLLAFCIGI